MELDNHTQDIAGCEVMARLPVDGITAKMKEKLQSRKKAFKGQTEEERWEQIYDIIFPFQNGTKPGPCKSLIAPSSRRTKSQN